LETNL